MLSRTLQRVIFSDNGTLIDITNNLNDYLSLSKTIDYVAGEDYIYIGSELPFNHRYFDVSSVNANASAVSISLWSGSAWESAVDVSDGTAISGVSMAQSGYMEWVLDRNKSWTREATTEDIPALSSLKIYDMYWMRIGFDADLTGTTALTHVGYKFASDDDLDAEYPDLNLSATKSAFKTGKTDWNHQHYIAAQEIIDFLKRKQHLWSGNQIFDWSQFTLAAVHKCALIIMQSFGDDYEDNRALANKRYHELMNRLFIRADKDQDGRLDHVEKDAHVVSWSRI